MSYVIGIDSDIYEEATLRSRCAEQIASLISMLCQEQRDGGVVLNASVLGDAMHGIELLLQDSQKLLAQTLLAQTQSEIQA